jgi:hypothetical protein
LSLDPTIPVVFLSFSMDSKLWAFILAIEPNPWCGDLERFSNLLKQFSITFLFSFSLLSRTTLLYLIWEGSFSDGFFLTFYFSFIEEG